MSELFSKKTVEDLAAPWKGSIKIGPFGSQLKREDMVEQGKKVYGQENVILNDWTVGERRVSDEKYNTLRSCELQSGDVVLSMMGTVGRCSIFPENAERGLMDSHLLRIQPNLDLVTREYLATVLQADNIVGRQVSSMSHGSIMAGLSSSIVRRFTIPLPPLAEQPVLSKVLDTLDTTIRQTEAIIEKLKQVKQGLLHDLLTRGIDANGELRPPQSEAPELYKESALGWIPKGWKAISFADLAFFVNGNSFNAENWSESGIPIIRIQNLNGSKSFNHYQGIIRQEWHVLPGDLLFAWSGQRGVSFGPRIWSGPEGVLNQHIFKVTERSSLTTKEFLFELLGFRQEIIENSAHGFKDSFLHVTRGELGGVLSGVPDLDEQSAILLRINSFAARLTAEQTTLQKLLAQKSGLMDDLLTGRVRVTPLLESAAA